jgi:hypothetical protein
MDQKNPDKHEDMGLPDILKSPKTVFPRTFRFLFIPKKNPAVQHLIQKVSIDYSQKSLDAFVMELADCRTLEWLQEMNQPDYTDDFTLVALDGCGYHLYVLEFSQVRAVWYSTEYDYAKSDVVTHHVGFEYDSMKTIKKRTHDWQPV